MSDTKQQVVVAPPPLANDLLARATVVIARIVVAFLWIQNTTWKEPPNFDALAKFTGYGAEYPVFPPYAAAVENLILPNIGVFGWFVLLSEAAIGAFLLIGFMTRLWGLIAFAQSFVIFLSVGLTPIEWPWSYYLMMVGSLVLAGVAAGRVWGLDALFHPIFKRNNTTAGKWLARAT